MITEQLSVRVAAVEQVAPMILEFTLVPEGGSLYPFSPGSHVIVEMDAGNGKTYKNPYSILSDPLDISQYKIAVRKQEVSRGGSDFMHQSVAVGDLLRITPPANMFVPFWPAKKHILIAGGVGITPFMSYLPEMLRRGANFELHYLFRTSTTGAYREELTALLGERYFEYDSERAKRCNVSVLLQNQPLGSHFYVCGPTALIEEINLQAPNWGLPHTAIHYEEFAAPKPGKPFEVTINSTGSVVSVGAEQSLLEALESQDIKLPNMCRGGVCGQCLCGVKEGDIEHRDSFLSSAEKTSGTLMMPCVSRARGERLVLDI